MSDRSDTRVRFEVLGSLRAWRGDIGVDLGPTQQRVILAVLLLQRNRPIGKQQLINAVWGDAEPKSAANLLHRHVCGLRRVLASDQLVWTDVGYVLTVPACDLDLEVFKQELDQARKARVTDDLQKAAKIFHSALALWQGPVCDGLAGPFLEAQRDRLNEWRIGIVEECLALDVDVGGRADVISELRTLIAEYPLRERLHSLLMLALYRAGRQADALATYRDLHQLLLDELAVSPSAPLQRLHQQILNADPQLGSTDYEETPNLGSAVISRALSVPAQLPHSTPGFTGREAEIDWLNALLADDDFGDSGAVVITAIAGTAGVGKTALAVHWAHQIRHRFPDGQLYINLRGFDPAGPPMKPAEAIRSFLDSFGVPPDRIPTDLDAQAALYRTLLASRRVLIVLDNARDADQVRQLFPGTPSCLVVVTSRNRLLSLVVDGAVPLTVDLLSTDQARGLLISRLGRQRVAAEPAAVDEVLRTCAGLPLALSIVCARASANSRLPLADLAAELSEISGTLDALDCGDQRASIRTVFSWSYRALSAPAARLFRLLGLHAGPHVSAPAAASLAGLWLSAVRTYLAELTGAHLITELGSGRFALHDLLRAYAGELADSHESAEDRHATVHRLLDHYLHSAYQADQLLRQGRDDSIKLEPPAPFVIPESPADHRKALAWFMAEYPVLLAALRQAAGDGLYTHTWQLAWALTSFFDRGGHWHDAAAAQRLALEAGQRLGNQYAQAKIHGCLAYAYIRLSRLDDARVELLRALELYEILDDGVGQAHVHRTLTVVLDRQGSYREGLSHAHQAVGLLRTAGYRTGEARALNAVGWFHIQLGDYATGLMHCQQALNIQKEVSDQFCQGDTLDSIGTAYQGLGLYREAISHYLQALDLFREFGDRYSEAATMARLGDTHLQARDAASADAAWHLAATILDELGHPDGRRVHEKRTRLSRRLTRIHPAR